MITKISFLCAIVLVANATGPYGVAVHNTGVSSSSRQQDAHGNYGFEYDIVDALGASNSRSEVGDEFGNKKGSYTLHDIDGRARRVDYIADGHGFRAVVNTNEPGTALSAPAGAVINSPYAGPAASTVVHTAPAIAQAVPLAVEAHVAPVSYSTKSVVSHAAPLTAAAYAAPLAAVAHTAPLAYSSKSLVSHSAPFTPVPVSHAIPSSYSTKSVISHDAPVAVPYAAPVAYSSKSVISPITVAHSSPLAYSTKSLVSHAAPIATVAHANPITVAHHIPASYSSKSVIANAAPILSPYSVSPFAAYNKGLGFSSLGYSHGLLGHQFGGLAYNTKLYSPALLGQTVSPFAAYNKGLSVSSLGYNHGLLGHQFGGLAYNTKLYNPALLGRTRTGLYHGNANVYGYNHGHSLLGNHLGGLTYRNGIFGYNGLKSYHY